MCELPSRENSTVAAHYVALERYFVGRRLLYAALQAGGCPANLENVGSNLCFIPALKSFDGCSAAINHRMSTMRRREVATWIF
jgi:hypothetical protein